MTIDKVYRILASSCDARLRCAELIGGKDGVDGTMRNPEWFAVHQETIRKIVRDFLPHGSGIDNGVKFDFDHSTGEKLVLHTAFHHMDENGFYDGWTEHTVTVRPSLRFGIDITISGPNRNEIKDYLADCFSSDLTAIAYWNDETKQYQRRAPIAVDSFAEVGAGQR